MEFILGTIYLVVSLTVLFCIAALLMKGEKIKSNSRFFGCQITVLLWCVSQILQFLSQDTFQLWCSYLIGNLGICFIGSAWYYFSKSYTERRSRKGIRYIPLLLSMMHFLLIATNDFHHLYYKTFEKGNVTHGLFFYSNVFWTYFFVLFGSVMLFRHMDKTKFYSRIMVVSSALLPVLLNAFYLTGLVQSSSDITPLGFALSTLLIMFATSKYNFINLERELNITTEKLLLERERNRIAQQVHDTSGHTLTMIQSYMKLAEISAQKENYDEVKDYLSEARILTAKGIKELRESINMLRQEAEYELVTQGVMQLANQVKEIPVEVTVKGEDNNTYSHLSKVIYDTVRESITNTLKYANASKIDIIIRFQKDFIELMIGDDGVGCENISENNGLRGIKERVEKAGGTVRFSTSVGEGFFTRVKLPV